VLDYNVRDGVAWLTLNRPEKLNAMTADFMSELRERMSDVNRDDAVRVAIFHGAGKCFSVGGDIEGFGELGSAGERRAYLMEAMQGYRAVEESPKPTIAAVHGFALGGGCELSMVCDLVVADETARFGTPEASVGLFPGPGIVRGRANVSAHTLKYMIFTGRFVSGEQAVQVGLANEVVPAGEHLALAEAWADDIKAKAPLALAQAKAFVTAGGYDRHAHAVDTLVGLQGSADHAEGIAAFVEKRKAVFKGA
jgi:enoyl-CoA hydratase/carnithine racemase